MCAITTAPVHAATHNPGVAVWYCLVLACPSPCSFAERSEGLARTIVPSYRLCPVQVKNKFKVAWVDPADPTKGFKHIYLSPLDYASLSATNSVIAERVPAAGAALATSLLSVCMLS